MYNKRELQIGSKIELEHTNSKKVARKIAKDHLKEYPNYYTKGLIPMERKLKRIKHKKCKGKLINTKKQINKIISEVPDFEKQARKFTKTKLQGGKK